jgi:N-acetylmuramoyl-L-alanine amidase
MTGLWLALAMAAGAPSAVTIASVRGEQRIPVTVAADGAPMLQARALLAALGGTFKQQDAWLDVFVARQQLRFLIAAPYVIFDGKAQPLVSGAVVQRDTAYLPLQLVTDVLPRLFSERYRYDIEAGRLMDAGWQLVKGTGEAAPVDVPAPKTRIRATAAPGGTLRRQHVVTVDAGHGGVDPGNPGIFFPAGMKEKDVTLQMSLLLREELRSRGITVRMTRTRDTLIALGDRGAYCTEECDLFVSLHVNSLPRRRGYTDVRGFETFFLAEAKTEDAERVAKMENEAVRFEPETEATAEQQGLNFILKDLAANEYLRESARLAELIQTQLGTVNPGGDRGVKQAGFMVLTTARRPAVLVEMGYSTNPSDAKLMTNRGSQQRMASAIADAVVGYLSDYERKMGDDS